MSLTVILILIFLFFPVLVWKTFEHAGFAGWKSAVPMYNYYIWLKIINKPIWWFIILLIPFINFFMVFLMIVETLKAYNIHSLGQQALAVLFPYVYLPWLGIKKGNEYLTPDKWVSPKKSAGREWVDAIIFAVVAASIIRMFMFEAYTIPTPSMEKSLLVGDYLFVSKLAYGPKLPNTPLSFPFVHNRMPITGGKSYLEWIKWPSYRFPGFGKLERYDPVVFNYPDGDTVALNATNISYYALVRDYGYDRVHMDKANFGGVTHRPVDKRDNYVKRCIGMPGDSLEIRDRVVYINGKPLVQPLLSEFRYLVLTDGTRFNPKTIEELDIDKDYGEVRPGEVVMNLTSEAVEKIRAMKSVKEVRPIVEPSGSWQSFIFPHDSAYPWNADNFGPIYIPKKGVTVPINAQNIILYRRIIDAYEGNDLKVENGKVFINGQEANSYTFKMDYYWMMGDNRHNSADSRYWGYVPEDHIVGKPVYVWLSINKETGKIRFNKTFRFINNK